MKNSDRPSFQEEQRFQAQGFRLIAGIDEVGCGALAGPVAAAAVILPFGFSSLWQTEVRDSKQLTPAKRESLSQRIREVAITIGIGEASREIIDRDGLTRARRLAMKRAIAQLEPRPEALLIDFLRLPDVKLPQKGVTDGDSLCFSIACASIIAKVHRDHLMSEMDELYPGYGFARHKGYGTAEHLTCLRRLGPSPVHRQSFQPVIDSCHSDEA